MAAGIEPEWGLNGGLDPSIGEPGQAYLRVPASLPFFPAQPDSVSDGGTVGGLAIRASSVRGLHHRYEGKPRQDAYGATLSADDEWFIAVVADGVSQGPKSQNAAALVSRHGPDLIRDRLAAAAPPDLDWWSVFEQLATIIVRHGRRGLETPSADRRPREPVASVLDVAKEMASTATFVVCHTAPSREDGWPVTVACQGDSPVWALSAEGRWRRLSDSKAPGPDGLGSSTVLGLPLLPAERGTHLVSTEILNPDYALFLMSDGVGDPLGEADDDVGLILGRAWAHPPRQHQFTAQVGFGRKGFDDDRTVVGIWADGGAFAAGGRGPHPAGPPGPEAAESRPDEATEAVGDG